MCIPNASSVPQHLLVASRRSTLHRQAPNPKNAIRREEYVDTWREGVHDLLTQIVTIFLERPSADLAPGYRCTRSRRRPCLHTPHNCFHAYSMRSSWPCQQFPNVLTAQFSQCATLFARPGFNFRTLILPLFEDAMRLRASGELCRAAEEFRCTPDIGWTTVRVTQADSRDLQGRQLGSYVHAGAGRTSPIAILVNTILAELNGLRLLASAALLVTLRI